MIRITIKCERCGRTREEQSDSFIGSESIRRRKMLDALLRYGWKLSEASGQPILCGHCASHLSNGQIRPPKGVDA